MFLAENAMILWDHSFLPLKRSNFLEYLVTSDQLASLVRFHRKRAGLSQVDMASMADVSRKVIQDLEASRDGVRWRNLMAVLAVLNIKLRPDGPLIEEWYSRSETESQENPKERESQ